MVEPRHPSQDLRSHRGTRRPLWRVVGPACLLLLVAVGVGRLGLQEARAAVVLAFFDVEVLENRVRILWGTSDEYNVAAFRLYCKESGEPDTAYHPLGSPIPARGGAEEAASYQFDVYSLVPDVSYCFRLEEIPTDDQPGEVFVRCGYGLNVTPTPVDTATPTATVTPTETPTPSETPTPTVTPTSSFTPGPTDTPRFTETPTPTPGLVLGTTPLPPYSVVTATFTPLPPGLRLTYTPVPTATPPASLMDQVTAGFSTTDLLLGLLCLGVIGAGGLGLLALMGALFFSRSRGS